MVIDGTPRLIGRLASVEPSFNLTGKASAFRVAMVVSTMGVSVAVRPAGLFPTNSLSTVTGS
jgi:hypothetical protein